jgi:hypothetical protein
MREINDDDDYTDMMPKTVYHIYYDKNDGYGQRPIARNEYRNDALSAEPLTYFSLEEAKAAVKSYARHLRNKYDLSDVKMTIKPVPFEKVFPDYNIRSAGRRMQNKDDEISGRSLMKIYHDALDGDYRSHEAHLRGMKAVNEYDKYWEEQRKKKSSKPKPKRKPVVKKLVKKIVKKCKCK